MKTTHLALALALVAVGSLAIAASAPPEPAGQAAVLRYREVRIAEGRRDEALQLWARFGSHFLSHYAENSYSTEGETTFRVFSPLEDFERADGALRALELDEGWEALEQQAEGVFVDDHTRLLFFIGGRPFDPGDGLRILRVTRSPQSSVPLARAFAKRVADHLDSQYERLRVSAYAASVDDPAAIYWIFEYADHVAFESVQRSLLEDSGYLDLYRQAHDLFLPQETFEARID
jgi:hypothetical protein